MMVRGAVLRGGAAVRVASAPGLGVPTNAVGGTHAVAVAAEPDVGWERTGRVAVGC